MCKVCVMTDENEAVYFIYFYTLYMKVNIYCYFIYFFIISNPYTLHIELPK